SEHVMDEIAMNAAVAVLERVNVNEAESKHCGCDHRVHSLRCAAIKSDHAVDEARQVFRPGADMMGQRHARFAIMLADEAAFPAQAELDEPLIADDDPLQTQKFLVIERPAPSLTNGSSPSLNAVLWRTFTFNCVARA